MKENLQVFKLLQANSLWHDAQYGEDLFPANPDPHHWLSTFHRDILGEVAEMRQSPTFGKWFQQEKLKLKGLDDSQRDIQLLDDMVKKFLGPRIKKNAPKAFVLAAETEPKA